MSGDLAAAGSLARTVGMTMGSAGCFCKLVLALLVRHRNTGLLLLQWTPVLTNQLHVVCNIVIINMQRHNTSSPAPVVTPASCLVCLAMLLLAVL